MSDLSCVVFLPDQKRMIESVSHVVVAAENGEMDIYPDHADSFVSISSADVRIVLADKLTQTIHVGIGGCYFSKNKFVLFVASQ